MTKDYFPNLEKKVSPDEVEKAEEMMTPEQAADSEERFGEARVNALGNEERDDYAIVKDGYVQAVVSSKGEVIEKATEEEETSIEENPDEKETK